MTIICSDLQKGGGKFLKKEKTSESASEYKNMKSNKKKNIALLIAAAFLFLALIDGWPYGFFTLLRFVVFTVSAYVAWMAYEVKKEKWVWIFGFLAVLFNPFIIIRLGREIWSIIDLIVGVFMIISLFALKLDKSKVK